MVYMTVEFPKKVGDDAAVAILGRYPVFCMEKRSGATRLVSDNLGTFDSKSAADNITGLLNCVKGYLKSACDCASVLLVPEYPLDTSRYYRPSGVC
ncbi:MAG: hypothetical protein V1900_03595 [Candidatus Aenigmatarchaeota archaeon]